MPGRLVPIHRRVGLVPLLLLGLLAACEKKVPPEAPPALRLTQVSFADLPGWGDDDVAAALPAFARSCARLDGQADSRMIGRDVGTVADWRAPCAALAAVPDGNGAAARAALEQWFVPFKMSAPDGETGLVTGYYEAELNGALFPGGDYRAPIYRRPDDLVIADLGVFAPELNGRRIVGQVKDGQLVPYLTRAQIEAGALEGRDLELLWADDPVDVFFLQVQGSGKVRFPDGTERRVGYAISNGRDFTGVGRLLLDAGKILPGQASMQGIRDWLRANPAEARDFMERNARFIFFRWVDGDGPIGAEGVALTAGRSIAVDPAFVPYGVPVFLDTTWPKDNAPLRRLMVAQDTGSAIKGPLRADFFWGSGDDALEHAGGMKQQGRFYMLLPKDVAERRAATS
jgi:membrane-bound lytic murein transglycosylase A